MADRIALVLPIFKKLGVPVTVMPVYNLPQSVISTAQINTTATTTTPTSYNVTKQPVKQKLINGKPAGKPVPSGKASTSTSTTKPKTGLSF